MDEPTLRCPWCISSSLELIAETTKTIPCTETYECWKCKSSFTVYSPALWRSAHASSRIHLNAAVPGPMPPSQPPIRRPVPSA